jgi:hypothetical protein
MASGRYTSACGRLRNGKQNINKEKEKMIVTKTYLQREKGCTRKQAVEFDKKTDYEDSDDITRELERVKKQFPFGGKKKAEVEATA